MKSAIDGFTVIAFSAIYWLSLAAATGFAAGFEFPWQPYHGKPAWEVYALEQVQDAVTVILVALFFAAGVAWRFPGRPFTAGLVVASPLVLYEAWSTLQAIGSASLLLRHGSLFIEHLATVLLAPALLAMLIMRFRSSNRFKPTIDVAA